MYICDTAYDTGRCPGEGDYNGRRMSLQTQRPAPIKIFEELVEVIFDAPVLNLEPWYGIALIRSLRIKISQKTKMQVPKRHFLENSRAALMLALRTLSISSKLPIS